MSSFPEHGIWTPLGLTRAQFFSVLGISIALFLFIGGPLWNHVRDSHFARIILSYLAIPVGVAIALAWNRRVRISTIAAGSVVIALIKLVVTAGLDVVMAIAQSPRG